MKLNDFIIFLLWFVFKWFVLLVPFILDWLVFKTKHYWEQNKGENLFNF